MKKIYFAIPIPYHEGSFWTRDSGLVVLALRRMGYEAWMVALGDATATPGDFPILCVTLEQLQHPEWWQGQQPDAVVLNTWSAPRYDAIRVAALAATPVVVERLDTDGVRSARLFPGRFIIRTWSNYRDSLARRWRWLAGGLTAARFSLLYLFPSLVDAKMVKTMNRLRGLIAESPVARTRMLQMLALHSPAQLPIEVIPHPVNEDVIRYAGLPKENQIISVGRWGAEQKDFPQVHRILRAFLTAHPDWKASIIGGGRPDRYRSAAPEEWERRVVYHEFMNHRDLAVEYNRSKIYLLASRYESFCIAAAEALCCGCSVVGSDNVATSSYFAELNSGTVAVNRSVQAFSQALDQELTSWTSGERDPLAVSRAWSERTGATRVAEQTLAFLRRFESV